jgi:twinkle protein
MAMNESAKDVADLLARDVERVCRLLLPDGKREGAEWVARNPARHDETPGSFKVRMIDGKVKAGFWIDFATNDSGDLLDLWCLVQQTGLGQAIKDAKAFLGLAETRFQPTERKAFKRPVKPKTIKALKPESPVTAYLKSRGLTEQTLADFKIVEHPNTFKDHPDNPADIVFPYLRDGELINLKHLGLLRPNGKKLITQASGNEPCLFGWQALDPMTRRVVLVEGELDAATLHQLGYPALSVPNGGGKGGKQNWVENEYDRLARFDEIFLCLDQDSTGEEGAMELAERLGFWRCRFVTLPYKDANECLMKGVKPEVFDQAFLAARYLDPKELRDAASYTNDVISLFYPPQQKPIGVHTPWGKVGDKIMFRPCEITVWSGYSSHGKSLVLNHIVIHALTQQERACIGSFEMPVPVTLQRMVRQLTCQQQPSVAHITAAMTWLSGKLWLFDLMGQARIDRVLEVFTYVRQRFGATQFVLDSMTMLGISDDDYKGQKAVMEKLAAFVNTHKCHVHFVVHPRKGDEYHLPGKMEIKGTGAVTDLAHNVMLFWKNKTKFELKELLIEENRLPTPDEEKVLAESDAVARVDKQRMNGWESLIRLWFEADSMQFLSFENELPRLYVANPEDF